MSNVYNALIEGLISACCISKINFMLLSLIVNVFQILIKWFIILNPFMLKPTNCYIYIPLYLNMSTHEWYWKILKNSKEVSASGYERVRLFEWSLYWKLNVKLDSWIFVRLREASAYWRCPQIEVSLYIYILVLHICLKLAPQVVLSIVCQQNILSLNAKYSRLSSAQ